MRKLLKIWILTKHDAIDAFSRKTEQPAVVEMKKKIQNLISI